MRRPSAGRLARAVVALALLAVTGTPALPSASGSPEPTPADASAAGDEQGYWLAGRDGSVYQFGGAAFHGALTGQRVNHPIAGLAPAPSGRGYWLVGTDGGVFSFGDARFHGSTGSIRLNKPIVGMAATPSGNGYWFVASDGGVFAFGDARFYGSMGGKPLNRPIVGMAPTPSGNGYWLVAADGGVFTFGDAGFFGSTGSIRLNQPIVGMAPTPSGRGYWLAASDGGVFSFGDARFRGSAGGRALPRQIMAMAGAPAPGAPPAQEPVSHPWISPTSTAPDPAATTTTVITGTSQPPPLPPGAFHVGLIGDTGYSDSQERAFLRTREHMNSLPLAFTVHDGDIWEGANPTMQPDCADSRYEEELQIFNGFTAPLIYTPGDNEWTDCSQDEDGRLEVIRRVFFPTDESLGQRRITLTRQHPEYVENARWTMGGVVFATMNVPGATDSGGNTKERREANVAWLHAAFDEAEATGAPGVMVIWQDNPFEAGGGDLLQALRDRTIAFGKPVVLVHGDTHQYRVDHPWSDVDNFTRVETHGDSSSGSWVRATVGPADPEVFSFDSERPRH